MPAQSRPAQPSIKQSFKMSSSHEVKIGNAPKHSTAKAEDKILYEETTTFSDPLPQKRDTFATAVSASDSDEDGTAYRKNPFLDPDTAEHWLRVYEKSQYECRGEFDPSFTWTEEEEKKLVRRLDWHVCLWAVSISSMPSMKYMLTGFE